MTTGLDIHALLLRHYGIKDPDVLDGSEILEHHGVKGMRWGVRKKSNAPSEDSARTSAHRARAKAEGVHVLSNKELQDFITRANLEQQFKRLTPTPSQKVLRFVGNMLTNVGKQQVNSVVSDQTKAVRTALTNRASG